MARHKEIKKAEPVIDNFKTAEIMLDLLVAVSQGQAIRETERKLALARQAEERARLELLDYLANGGV